MVENTSSIVSRVWSFCTTLRDDGVVMEIIRTTNLFDFPKNGR